MDGVNGYIMFYGMNKDAVDGIPAINFFKNSSGLF
jgi:hypothetical protein